jgi:hypothetical protein
MWAKNILGHFRAGMFWGEWFIWPHLTYDLPPLICGPLEVGANVAGLGLGSHLAKKVPHTATTPIATAFKICISNRKSGLLNRLPAKVSFSSFD